MMNFRQYSSTATEIVIPDKIALSNDNFSGKFAGMTKLTRVVIPNKVTNIRGAYKGCVNLTSKILAGENVVDMDNAYYGCKSLSSTCYILSKNVANTWSCFDERDTSVAMTVYVPKGSKSLKTFVEQTWRKCQGGSCASMALRADRKTGLYYSNIHNVYFDRSYANVYEAMEENGDLVSD